MARSFTVGITIHNEERNVGRLRHISPHHANGRSAFTHRIDGLIRFKGRFTASGG